MPALFPSSGIVYGQTGILPKLAKSAGFRTNAGFANLGAGDASVRIALFAADGAALGTARDVLVPAGRWLQLDDIFTAVGAGPADLAYARVELLTEGGRAWAYASVIDNATGDPTTIGVVVP
jgi:hypothetical protein